MENNDSKKSIIVQQVYAAPLPPPNILADYEKVYPGTVKIIIENYKEQSKHRIELEKNILPAREKQAFVGQLFAFIISLGLLVLAFFALKYGYPAVVTTICGVTLVGVIYAFVSKKKAK